MTDGGHQVEQDLADAVRDRLEAERLGRRVAEALLRAAERAAEVERRAQALRAEERDVEKLESFSPTRIWAALTGSRDSDLDREAAERDAARYALAEAEARRDAEQREHDALAAQLARLGDVEDRYRRALAGKDAWLREAGGPTAAELVDLAERRGVLAAEQQELSEAARAGSRAGAHLEEARRVLGSAQSWATWDTFGGGGLVTDMVKYDRLDKATSALRDADRALRVFARELADVDLEAVPGVELSSLTKVFDVFFDNIFTDWSVRSRVQGAAERTRATLAAVDRALDEVGRRSRRVNDELDALNRRREELLLG